MKKIYGVSLTEEVHELGMQKAKKSGMSFSTYVAYLILKK